MSLQDVLLYTYYLIFTFRFSYICDSHIFCHFSSVVMPLDATSMALCLLTEPPLIFLTTYVWKGRAFLIIFFNILFYNVFIITVSFYCSN